MVPEQTPQDCSPQAKLRRFIELLARQTARELAAGIGTCTTSATCLTGTRT